MVLTGLILFPIVAAMVIPFLRGDKIVRVYTLLAGLVEIALSIPLITGFKPGAGFQFVEKAKWIPSLGLNYYVGVDGISILMVLLTVFLLPLTVLCSWTYIKKRVKEFHVALLLTTAACIGLFSVLNLVLFYIFWEAMLIPMFLIIAVWGGPRKKYASIKFFLYTLAGSVLLLVAIIAFYKSAGTFSIPELMKHKFSLTFQIFTFLAMALAFAIKVPMFPFHTWLPAAHVEAPTAGSVILASVLLKMGTYGFLRLCLPLAPEASVTLAPLMIVLSVISIIYGGFVALGQTDIKKLIAYSSVAHMGFVTLGIFMFNLRGVEGALMQMLNHGITTGALFMLVGALYERSHSREIEDNLGLSKYMPIYMGFFLLFALSSFAFPGTNSFVGEMLVLIGTFTKDVPLGLAVIPGALLAAAYMLRLTLKLAWGEPSKAKNWKDLTLREMVMLLPLAFFVIYIGVAPGIFLKTIDPSIKTLISHVEKNSNGKLINRHTIPSFGERQ
ncbi:complex I subunit 4 family protein [Desulfurobacterium sp.]